MTVDTWIVKSGKVFRKAQDFEAVLNKLAGVAAAEGCVREAASLRRIAARAAPMADFFVAQLAERVVL